MKKNIHPETHDIYLEFPDKNKMKISSTYGKKNDTLKIDIDIFSHPAWNESINPNQADTRNTNVAKFNKRFSGFSISSSKPKKVEKQETEKVAKKKATEIKNK